jgi:surfactin synthase thioesterase subunit
MSIQSIRRAVTAVKPIDLFLFPFAGGAGYAYRDLEGFLPRIVNPVPVDLPGHGKRMRLPLLKDLEEMADDLYRQILSCDRGGRMETPYAVYGHSMGATLGYLVARRAADEGRRGPVHLFASGRQAPTIPSRESGVHLLDRPRFMERLRRYGGIPDAVLDEQDLMELFEPILRADFEAVGGYRHTPREPLDLPVTVLIGTEDTVSFEDALRWGDVTARPVNVKRLTGGHFFLLDHLEEIGRIIEGALGRNGKPEGTAPAGCQGASR